MMLLGKPENTAYFGAILIIGIFLLFAFSCITTIGLNYDEAMFVNSALGGLNDEFIFKRILGIPFMVLPDQGAIKSYLYYPIFKLFGVNVLSIRIPAIILSAISLLIWFEIGKKILNNNYYALLLLTLMGTDPAYILHSRVDTVPFVLQNFLMASVIYLYLRSLETKSFFYTALSCFAILLGLINKISFLWFASAFIYVVILYQRKHLATLYRLNPVKTFALFVFFIGSLILITSFLILPPALHYPVGGMTHTKLSVKIPFVFQLYLETLNGNRRYLSIFYQNIHYPTLANIIEIPCFALWLISAGFVKILKINNQIFERYKKDILFFLMIFAIDLIFIFLTPHTYTPGHIMALWPLPHILFILMFASILCLFNCNNIVFTLVQMIPIALIGSQCYVNHEYNVAFKDPAAYKRYIWMPAIYRLSDYVNQNAQAYDNIISADLGIHTQLFALANSNQERTKIHELWGLFSNLDWVEQSVRFMKPEFNKSDAENHQWMYDTFYKNKHNLIIMFSTGEISQNSKRGFFNFVEKYKITLTPLTIIHSEDGREIYSLFTTDS